MNKPLSSPIARIACAAALAAAGLAPAPAAFAAGDPIGSEHFASGWQSATTPLINRGIAAGNGRPGTMIWKVPANLPRGHYLVIDRQGDRAELINGYSFDITSAAYRDINVSIPSGYGYVEALPERFVPEVKPAASPARFEGK
jgi:hypothetical protein